MQFPELKDLVKVRNKYVVVMFLCQTNWNSLLMLTERFLYVNVAYFGLLICLSSSIKPGVGGSL